ncbi:UNVERIFIED_CONTAM: hypothetical protein FKN15_032798 [Acipenser sinensis]
MCFQSHTILLVQPTKRPEGRTYADYESVNECMEGVCKMYEEHLKRMNPNSPSITYDISQLFDFIDDLADLSCLVKKAASSVAFQCLFRRTVLLLLARQSAGAVQTDRSNLCSSTRIVHNTSSPMLKWTRACIQRVVV